MMRGTLLMAIASVWMAACGSEATSLELRPINQGQQSIVGGAVCQPGQFPETGLIRRNGTAFCSGTLIAPDTVLTAAHCAAPGWTGKIRELEHVDFVRETAPTEGPHAIAVRRYIVHPQYEGLNLCTSPRNPEAQRACQIMAANCGGIQDSEAYDQCVAELPHDVRVAVGAVGVGQAHDLALLFLNETISGVAPARLLPPWRAQDIQAMGAVDIVGYGIDQASVRSLAPNDRLPSIKRWGNTLITSTGSHELLTAAAPNAYACKGDSGGPVILQDDNRHRTQIGVASRIHDYRPETGCATGLVYTRVDAHLPWVLDAMELGCNNGARITCEMPEVVAYKPEEGCAITSVGLWVAIAVGLLLLKYRRAP